MKDWREDAGSLETKTKEGNEDVKMTEEIYTHKKKVQINGCSIMLAIMLNYKLIIILCFDIKRLDLVVTRVPSDPVRRATRSG